MRHSTLYPRINFKRTFERDPTRGQKHVAAVRRGRAGTAVSNPAASYTEPRGPNPRTIAHGGKTKRESGHGSAASYTQTRGGGVGIATAVPDTAPSYTAPPTHFYRKPEIKAYPRTKKRVVEARRERAGTTVPDTAASYTQPRGPNLGTTVRGGIKRRERGHGCTRHHDIIHSTEREGGVRGVIAVPDPTPRTSLAR